MTYLDYNATTPVDPRVLEAMIPFFSEHFGNPSSSHSGGLVPKRERTLARERIAALLGAKPERIVFTSGGTESDNAAIKGAAFAPSGRGRHIVTCATEHHAVLHTCAWLEERFGFEITVLPVDGAGLVDPAQVDEAIREDTVAVTIMLANNETGTVNPLAEIARVTRDRGVLLHTDAVQAMGKIPVKVDALGVDLLSLSGHKIYGPKGMGALYVREGVKVDPLLHGGGHEGGLRAGTENIPGIVGLGKAAELAHHELEEYAAATGALRDRLWGRIEREVPEVILNGHSERRLPNTLNVSFPGIEGESLLMMLDQRGFALSTGSACSSEALEPSHVLTAMGLDSIAARGALRISFGRDTKADEVEAFADALVPVAGRLRAMSPL